MYIKQCKQFKFQFGNYSLLDIKREYPISYVAMLFYDGFPYINTSGVAECIENLKTINNDGMCFEMVELSMDNKNSLAYISEPYDKSQQKITAEIEQLVKTEAIVELCRRNFIKHAVMTQENLFHLFLTWKKFVDKQAPYILIYLDDQDKYDSLSFDSRDAMDRFVAGHTNKKANEDDYHFEKTKKTGMKMGRPYIYGAIAIFLLIIAVVYYKKIIQEHKKQQEEQRLAKEALASIDLNNIAIVFWTNESDVDCHVTSQLSTSDDKDPMENEQIFSAHSTSWIGFTCGHLKINYLDQSISFDLKGLDTYYFIMITKDGILECSTQDVPEDVIASRKAK